MEKFKKRHKQLTSLVLSAAMIFSLVPGTVGAKAETRVEKQVNQTAERDTNKKSVSKTALKTISADFKAQKFAELYEEGGLSCTTEGITFDTETAADNLLLTGKNKVVSGAAITLKNTLDFGTDKVQRIQIDALAKKATKTYMEVYLDDAVTPTVRVRIPNQPKTDNWTRTKVYSYEFAENEKLTGKHKVRVQLQDETTAADKKTSVLLRSIQFVQESIPTVSFDIDESLGSISEMNGDSSHNTECYGKMNIDVPEGYAAEYGKDPEAVAKKTAGSYDMEYIRGRGNSTWTVSKKPYKIKLDKKADLFGMGKNKHWVLIANYYDNSLVRNRLTYYLGRKLGMEYTPECVPVDVIMNHEYLGSYLLCEQIRLDENRVDENNLEKADKGADVSGGYLLSMEPNEETDNVIKTKYNSYLIESPETGACQSQAKAYIENYMKKTEDAIYGDDFKNEDGTSYQDLMDVKSAIAYYWMQEVSMNGDAFISTSTYLYKKQDTADAKGKLYWGPLWDFDYVAWSSNDYSEEEDSYSGFVTQRTWFNRLMEDPEFAQQVKEYWVTLAGALEDAIADGGILDRYAQELAVSADNNFNKWGFNDFSDDGYDDNYNSATGKLSYAQEIQRLKTWIADRVDWIDNNLDTIAPKPVTLTYMVDGEVYKKVTTTSTKENDIPSAPTKEGYIFTGWYHDKDDFSVRQQKGDIFTEDTTLTAQWEDESKLVKPTKIALERSEIYVPEWHEFHINYGVAPYNANTANVTLTSSDNTVVRLQESDYEDSDYIKPDSRDWMAVKAGTATITISAGNGVSAKLVVHVIPISEYFENEEAYTAKDFTLDQNDIVLKVGQEKKLNLKLDRNEVYTSFYWTSSDDDIVELLGGGLIHAKKAGTAYILVTMNGIDKTKVCRVVVQDGTAVKPTPAPTKTPGKVVPLPQEKTEIIQVGNVRYKQLSANTVKMTGIKKDVKKVTVPATIKYKGKTYKVTEVASGALRGKKKLQTVVIGKNVTKIGANAFSKCKKLKKVQITSKKLKKVTKKSFAGIAKKVVIKVPKSKKKAYKKWLKSKKVA